MCGEALFWTSNIVASDHHDPQVLVYLLFKCRPVFLDAFDSHNGYFQRPKWRVSDSNEWLLSFIVENKKQTTIQVLKLPIEILRALTKALYFFVPGSHNVKVYNPQCPIVSIVLRYDCKNLFAIHVNSCSFLISQ